MQLQIRDREIPVRGQPHPPSEPALQLRNLLVDNPPLCVSPPRSQSVPVKCCIRVPYELQMGEQGMPARRQPHPRMHPALQLHGTMRISLSGAGDKSVGIGRREPLYRIHPHAVGLMLFSSLAHSRFDMTSYFNVSRCAFDCSSLLLH